MFKIGNKNFIRVDDYEDRFMEVNPKDTISQEIKDLINSIPKNEVSKFLLDGNESYEKSNFSDAAKNYSSALDIEPNDTLALFYRGLSYINLENFNGAFNDLSRLIGLKPEFIDARFYRANASVALQTYNHIISAISDYSFVIERKDHAHAYFLRGFCFMQLKKEEEAILDWRKSREFGITKHDEAEWRKDYLE